MNFTIVFTLSFNNEYVILNELVDFESLLYKYYVKLITIFVLKDIVRVVID